ncbi:MAG: hypothetical protein NVS3B20_06820 [Polyangiales bacterium]
MKFNNDGVFKVSGGGQGSSVRKGTSTSAGSKVKGNKKVAKATQAIVAEWPGFRNTDDGGSEVLVAFSKAVETPTERKGKGAVTYVFKGAHVLKSNNRNPLLTVHFNTPVMKARLVPKKGELHLVIELRPGTEASGASGLRAGDGGGQQFFVKFGAGNYLPAVDDAVDGPMKKSSANSNNGNNGTNGKKSNGGNDGGDESAKKARPTGPTTPNPSPMSGPTE